MRVEFFLRSGSIAGKSLARLTATLHTGGRDIRGFFFVLTGVSECAKSNFKISFLLRTIWKIYKVLEALHEVDEIYLFSC